MDSLTHPKMLEIIWFSQRECRVTWVHHWRKAKEIKILFAFEMFCVRVERHTKVVVCCCCRCYSLRGTSCWRTGGESQTAGQALSSSRLSTGFFLCSTNGRASWLAGSLTNDMYVTYESTPPLASWRPPTPMRLRASRRCRHLAEFALDNRLLQSRTHPVALFYFSFWFYFLVLFFFFFFGREWLHDFIR